VNTNTGLKATGIGTTDNRSGWGSCGWWNWFLTRLLCCLKMRKRTKAHMIQLGEKGVVEDFQERKGTWMYFWANWITICHSSSQWASTPFVVWMCSLNIRRVDLQQYPLLLQF
jgi:hypothetical protein